MNGAAVLEAIRQFQARFNAGPGHPVIFLDSLIRLADWADEKRKPMQLCWLCHGWGIVKRGPCPCCDSLGYTATRG